MNAKDYLERIWRLNLKIRNLEADAGQYRDMAYNISQDATQEHFNPNHPTNAPYVKCLEKADLIERAVAEKKEKLEEMKAEASGLILKLENAKYVSLLLLRYVEFWPWEDISNNIGISESHTYRLRREAIDAFSEIYENNS